MEIKRNVDVQFLKDFAIIGHPKCCTIFLLANGSANKRKLSCRPGKRASCRDRPEPCRWYKPCTPYSNYLWPHRYHPPPVPVVVVVVTMVHMIFSRECQTRLQESSSYSAPVRGLCSILKRTGPHRNSLLVCDTLSCGLNPFTTIG
jgi:hypothetical protein